MTTGANPNELIVHLPQRNVTFYTSTPLERQEWIEATRSARCRVRPSPLTPTEQEARKSTDDIAFVF